MNLKKPPLPLLILGWIAIIATPIALLVFGWRDIELTCRRPGPGAPPTCQVSETFAMGLYTRKVTAEQATGVGFQIRAAGAGKPGGGSTVILATPSGQVPVSRGASSANGDAKAELIRKMQEFLATPNSLEFRHHARMHGLLGYLGAVGVFGLACLLLTLGWCQARRRVGRKKASGEA